MKIERRQFLGRAVTGSAGAMVAGTVPASSAAAAPAKPVSLDPTAMVPLGEHLKVSRIGMGFGMKAWDRQSNLTKRGRKHAEDTIRYAYDQGVRFFDNADIYGSHQYLARALADKPRESYAVASKIWFHPRGIPEEDRGDADVVVKRFLKECNTDYLDLVQIHCMTRRDWTTEMRKQMDLLAGLKERGLIRAHGVSCHAIPAIEAAAAEPWVDVVHVRINPFGIKMDKPAEKLLPVLEKVSAAGRGVIGMKLIGEGAFADDRDKREESIRFVMGTRFVDVMVVGFEVPAEIDELKDLVRRNLVAMG
jgi:aryl-alcohol dehydrogenase-like predicted oxidoreductase